MWDHYLDNNIDGGLGSYLFMLRFTLYGCPYLLVSRAGSTPPPYLLLLHCFVGRGGCIMVNTINLTLWYSYSPMVVVFTTLL